MRPTPRPTLGYRGPVKVFISWSGPVSRQVAVALRDWLPTVVQVAQPWMSDQDIGPGERWGDRIASQLQDASFGIICVTPDNQRNPWLNFEAGAISKVVGEARVVPYVYGLTELSNLQPGPITQFQAKKADRTHTLEIARAINAAAGGILTEDALQRVFNAMWPEFQASLDAVEQPNLESTAPRRSDSEKIDEILSLLRTQSSERIRTDVDDWLSGASKASGQGGGTNNWRIMLGDTTSPLHPVLQRFDASFDNDGLKLAHKGDDFQYVHLLRNMKDELIKLATKYLPSGTTIFLVEVTSAGKRRTQPLIKTP